MIRETRLAVAILVAYLSIMLFLPFGVIIILGQYLDSILNRIPIVKFLDWIVGEGNK